MKKLNLTNQAESSVSYKISNFPDGQQDIVIDRGFVDQYGIYFPIQICSRFNSFRDLELIICATKALRRLGIKEVHLYIPYLLGARSDRQFQEGGTSYLVDVVAPIINALNFESVTVMDVHSDVAAACVQNLKWSSNQLLVEYAIADIENRIHKMDPFVLVSPDAGALKKIYKISTTIDMPQYNHEIIVASKHRGVDGKITHTEVPGVENYLNKDFIIIDDICDGGRTFIEIAKAIKSKGATGKIFLIATHGIFSAGLKELSEYFDRVYTTNSIMDISTNTEFGMRNERYLDVVNQKNIF